MAGSRVPGPLMGFDESLDDGTLCRALSPVPGPVRSTPLQRNWYAYSSARGFAANHLRLSPDGSALLKAVEHLALAPYDDQTGKATTVWVEGATIGYGHLIKRAEWETYQSGITEAAADALFSQDLAPFEQVVGEVIWVGVQQYEFDALVILAFNIGAAAFRGSSVAKLVNDPAAKTSYVSLKDAWMSWNKSQGKVMKGLDNRRRCEWDIFTSARYVRW
jgi:GH24 family phage-related lysozyme (muramidase)